MPTVRLTDTVSDRTAIVSEFEIDAAEFVLGDVLAGPLEVEVAVERLVPADEAVVPYLWVGGPDAGRFADRAAACPDVAAIELRDVADGWRLFRVEWSDGAETRLAALAGARITLLEARGADRWHVRARFASRANLSAFHDACRDCGVDLTLSRVRARPPEPGGGVDLTDSQREALSLAIERGYFDVPRETTLSELAAELGISTQAASERLRRGTDAALRASLRTDRAPQFD